jgi:hypothetical protein
MKTKTFYSVWLNRVAALELKQLAYLDCPHEAQRLASALEAFLGPDYACTVDAIPDAVYLDEIEVANG